MDYPLIPGAIYSHGYSFRTQEDFQEVSFLAREVRRRGFQKLQDLQTLNVGNVRVPISFVQDIDGLDVLVLGTDKRNLTVGLPTTRN
tara:strand:- start:1328 stop:1588 length:261 start_codon:yes stop_codon:yes gene_type:complete